MFDTQLTIVGNVLTAPQLRRTTASNQVAASFRVVSTSRRYDRANGTWIDGQSLRVRVTCWRRLAEGVAAGLKLGDPVIVVGRLYTRDWTDEQGNHRVLYELDATSVGHDLAHGAGTFQRYKHSSTTTSAVEDEEADRRIGGEDSIPEDLDPTPDLHAAGFTSEDSDSDDTGLDDDFDEESEDRRVLAGV